MESSEKPFSPAWMRAQFAASGRRQTELVAFLRERGLKVDATKINRSTKGGRDVQQDEMPHIWEFFGLPDAELAQAMRSVASGAVAARSPIPNAGLPEPVKFDRETMPLLGIAQGGRALGRIQFNGQVLGHIARPMSLAGVPGAYGTYVHGDSMVPRYEAGEVVLVNPNKGVRRGNYVVAQVYDNDADPAFGYVKKFVSLDERELVLEQLNPPEGEDRIMRFDRRQVVAVHKIVGTLDE